MWICFNDAFVSAVADPKKPGTLKVRARKRDHLERLFPHAEIHESTETDYRYRVFVRKRDFACLLVERAMDIDYGNFKDSVKDKGLHDLYAGFWHDHYAYQGAKKL